MLSGDKEERVELMVLLIRNLLKENKDMRDMVKSMASFIGEGESTAFSQPSRFLLIHCILSLFCTAVQY